MSVATNGADNDMANGFDNVANGSRTTKTSDDELADDAADMALGKMMLDDPAACFLTTQSIFYLHNLFQST